MNVVRVAVFDEVPELQEDDERRAASLRELVRNVPGFVAGFHLREEGTGRLMSFTIWESDQALERGEEVVRERPPSDQRGIQPSRVETWVLEGTF